MSTDPKKPTLPERIRNACAEMRRKPYPIADLIPMLQESADRIEQLERLDSEAASHVEAVICMRSGRFTGEPPYVGWAGLGKAMTENYDELDRLRNFAEEIRDGKWRGAEARRVATLVLDEALPPLVGLVPPMER